MIENLSSLGREKCGSVHTLKKDRCLIGSVGLKEVEVVIALVIRLLGDGTKPLPEIECQNHWKYQR